MKEGKTMQIRVEWKRQMRRNVWMDRRWVLLEVTV